MLLNLTKPIIFFDLETTGTNIVNDRIVEFSYIKVFPDGSEERKTRRLNPEMHIPAEATAIHHIADSDVADEPTFRQVAKSLYDIFENCDIAGFNSNKFDVPMLMQEFSRCGMKLELTGRRLIDVQTIFHKMEQRTLVAAYKFYCGKELEGAHSALADTEATYEVLKSQLDMYPTLKNDMDFLADFSCQSNSLDLAARIVKNASGEPVFNFGKYKGRTVREVLEKEPGYYDWMLQGDFPQNTKDVMTALRAQYRTKKQNH